jgi:hypothetical protein
MPKKDKTQVEELLAAVEELLDEEIRVKMTDILLDEVTGPLIITINNKLSVSKVRNINKTKVTFPLTGVDECKVNDLVYYFTQKGFKVKLSGDRILIDMRR